MKFLQVNLHKSVQATTLAGQAMESKTSTLSLITEPHTINNALHSFPRGTTIVYDCSKSHNQAPRAGIVATKDLQLTSLDKWCGRDCAAGVLKIANRSVLIGSIYLDINKPVRQQWLEDLLNMAKAKSWAVVLGIDTNAHSQLLGPDNNERGDELEDLILQHNLSVENQGLAPTFEIRRGNNLIQTHIDATLTRDLPVQIQNWEVNRDYNASDHNTIEFSIPTNRPPKTRIRPWSKADWGLFRKELQRADYRVPEAMSMKKLDRFVERLYQVLNEALDRSCPRTTVQHGVKSNLWFTEKHEKEKKRVSTLYDKAKRWNHPTAWEVYKEADLAFK